MKSKILNIIVMTIFISVATISCNEDGLQHSGANTGGKDGVVSIVLDSKDYSYALGTTRSVPEGLVNEGNEGNNTISNLWLVEFDERGKRIGTPRYFDDIASIAAVPVIKPDNVGVDYTLVAIANAGNKLNRNILESCEDIKDLWKSSYIFNDQSCGYAKEESEERGRLVMNGSQTLNNTTTNICIPMYRNVAKISIDITNKTTSGVNIRKVRLCNIPSYISFADQYVKGACASMADKADVFNLPFEEWKSESQDGQDGKMSLLYYVPRNMQGDTESREAYTKNSYAPSSATYLEIIANDADNGTALRYRFYLGKDMKGNFDIEPNYQYHLPVVISSKGEASLDSRVESFNSTDVMVSSNSYIISYNNELQSYVPTSIPIDRINHFWLHERIKDKDAADFVVQAETDWVAQVIWQDTDEDIFHFCNHDGSEKTDNRPHFHYGHGTEDFMVVKPTGKGSGNVLIGVRKNDPNWDEMTDGYMWSWHLWITDYNPYYNGMLQDNVYKYSVDGGEVHRYDTEYWKDELSKNKAYIMDRNFGALTKAEMPYKTENKDKYRYIGVSYHVGRKDPWPRKDTKLTRYAVENNSEIKKSGYPGNDDGIVYYYYPGNVPLEYSVRHPNVCKDNQLVIADYSYNDWNLPGWDKYDGKSLFDPTPRGWRLPYANECPSSDNFQNTGYTSETAFYFRLNNNAENSANNIALFQKTGFQAAVSGNVPWCGEEGISAVLTQTPMSTDNRPRCWDIRVTGGKIVANGFSVTDSWRGAVTRLIRDPRQD